MEIGNVSLDFFQLVSCENVYEMCIKGTVRVVVGWGV